MTDRVPDSEPNRYGRNEMDEPTERDRQRMRKVAALHIQDAKALRLRGKPLAAYDLTFDELLGLLGYVYCMLEVERKNHA